MYVILCIMDHHHHLKKKKKTVRETERRGTSPSPSSEPSALPCSISPAMETHTSSSSSSSSSTSSSSPPLPPYDDSLDPDLDFVDAESPPPPPPPPSLIPLPHSILPSSSPDDECSSVESFDSAQERIALASALDSTASLDSSSLAPHPQPHALSSSTVSPEVDVGMLPDTGVQFSPSPEMGHDKPEVDCAPVLHPAEEYAEGTKGLETNLSSSSGANEVVHGLKEYRDGPYTDDLLSSDAQDIVEDHAEEDEVPNPKSSQVLDARDVLLEDLGHDGSPKVKAAPDTDEENLTDDREKDDTTSNMNGGVQGYEATMDHSENILENAEVPVETGKVSNAIAEVQFGDSSDGNKEFKGSEFSGTNGTLTLGEAEAVSEICYATTLTKVPVLYESKGEATVEKLEFHPYVEPFPELALGGGEQASETACSAIESSSEPVHFEIDNTDEIPDENTATSKYSREVNEVGEDEPLENGNGVEKLHRELLVKTKESVPGTLGEGHTGQELETTEESKESLRTESAYEVVGQEEISVSREEHPEANGECEHLKLVADTKADVSVRNDEDEAEGKSEDEVPAGNDGRKIVVVTNKEDEEEKKHEECASTETKEENDETDKADSPESVEIKDAKHETLLSSSTTETPESVEIKEDKYGASPSSSNMTETPERLEIKDVKPEAPPSISNTADTPESGEIKDAKPEAPSSSLTKVFVTEPSSRSQPAGLGASIPALEITSRSAQRGTGMSSRQSAVSSEENSEVSEGNDDAKEKLHMIRVKFLRLAHRLGQSAHNVVVAQVLYRLGLAEQLRGGRATGRTGSFSMERASALAEEQEAAGLDDLDFGCTIMVLGKSGVGKSATINSLFDEVKSPTNAYNPATNKVREIIGTIHGIKLRVIDTPGLLTSFADQPRNRRIMSSVKRLIKKSPPDIVLYFDRLDIPSRDYGDLPLLRTITETFGAAVWFNAIVVLTHASSAPPDGANGAPVSYEMFVAQRSHIVQQTIRQAAGDMRLMNPVSLVENHDACRRNRAGQRVLPNGQVWQSQLLLLCFASKILAEANALLKLQDSSPTKPLGVRSRVPPLPFLLSSLLQSRAPLQLPDEQAGGDDDYEDSDEDESDSEGEEEYDDLPPFRRLTKDELKLLDKEQTKIYFEELDYREKLFVKKQLKEERLRRKEMKRRLASKTGEAPEYVEENMEDENASAAVPVPMPDMALPPSFDSDNPTYRYRYLDTPNQFLVRPVLETHGWDHDSGYDGVNVERMLVISKKIPASISGQISKDKKEASLQMECSASFKNGEGKVTQAGLDVQTIGKDLAYTLRSETKFHNFKRNKTTCGLSVTILGDTMAAGMKVENQKMFGKRAKLVLNGGAITGRTDVAYGGSLEASLRDKDYPVGQFMSNLGLSVMNWHGDLAIGGNLQVQFKVGKTTLISRGNLNNRGAGQVSIRASSSEQLQMALIGLVPLLRTLLNSRQTN